MKKRIDFILNEDDYIRDIFRFYPRRSHVHGFGEKCPQSWDEVYKVYYNWAIIRQYRFDTGIGYESYAIFTIDRDECSAIGKIPSEIKKLKIGEKIKFSAMGCGAEWNINYFEGNEHSHPCYKFTIWDNFTNQGYRFDLSPDEAQRFSKYIDYVQEYMLEHSEPI